MYNYLTHSVGKQKKHLKKDNSLMADETTRLTTMTEEDEDDSEISIKVTNVNDSKFLLPSPSPKKPTIRMAKHSKSTNTPAPLTVGRVSDALHYLVEHGAASLLLKMYKE
ncbi:sodium-driven chloride bicarbonate exchanger [Lasius niger]|uniref:Sodium-driven chloride bicarbonate exchanger n=1 Tax=Lasius niger TaxID=67767 RepID=A0A0J7JZ26_LASNI|nr:sodium-driven chloride bicarbonate exchanger [Lasius niger]